MNASVSSYVKNIGPMFESLTRNMTPQSATATLAREPIALRVEAVPLSGSAPGVRPMLTQCSCTVTANTWVAAP
jgi:hypothetical protein